MIFKKKSKAFDLQRTIEKCKKRDSTAQRSLFDHYAGFAKTICLRYAANDFEAEEMMSDGFLKVFQHIDKYKEESPFEGWFRRIMVNAAIDYFRKYHARLELLSIDQVPDVQNEVETISLLSKEEIMAFVQRLSPAYRIVFSMSVVDGYSHTEIATSLECTESAVRANLAKARAKLKQWITEYLERQPHL